MSQLVDFPGHGRFWLQDGGALAPLEHCNAAGEIEDLDVALFSVSYAHVFADGIIRRHRLAIGRREDLIVVNELECWTIYDHPTDYPDHFVLRRSVIAKGAVVPDSYAMVASDVEELRDICRQCGLTVVQTAGTDPDPNILEVWM